MRHRSVLEDRRDRPPGIAEALALATVIACAIADPGREARAPIGFGSSRTGRALGTVGALRIAGPGERPA